jgi:predicted MFS family arabinose efflux permease
VGRAVSFLGNAMANTALAFAVLDVTGSKSDLGFVLAARSVPQVIFILVGGIWADRLPRNAVMVGSNLASMATQGTLAALLLTGNAELWMLIAIAALNGTVSAFFFPASAGIVPQTIPPDLIQQANALLRLVLNSTAVVGAALGGVLVVTVGPGWAIAIDAATFGLGALFVGLMRLPPIVRERAPSFYRELAEGWQAFRSRTWLWAIVLQFSIVNAAFSGALLVLGPVQADNHFGRGWWAAILVSESFGLICGGLLMLRIRPQRMLLLATFSVLPIALPLALLGGPSTPAAIAVASFLAGFSLEIFAVCWDTTMQQQIPGEMLSRVYSYDMLGSIALVPLGLAVIGPIADAIGTQEALYGTAALIVIATLPVLAVRDVRELRRR